MQYQEAKLVVPLQANRYDMYRQLAKIHPREPGNVERNYTFDFTPLNGQQSLCVLRAQVLPEQLNPISQEIFLQEGQRVKATLTLNAVKRGRRLIDGKKKSVHFRPADLAHFARSRLRENGLDEISFLTPLRTTMLQVDRHQTQFPLNILRLSFYAVITSAVDVEQAVLSGIGRGKGLGMGLLSLNVER